MTRAAVVVEGETEEEFVKQLLLPHLAEHGILVVPIKPAGRGGNIHVDWLAPAIAKLSWDFEAVTTLVDFYGFGRRQPGETVEELEARIDLTTGNHSRREPHQVPRFAYVQRFEFEALLLSDPGSFGVLPELSASACTALDRVAAEFACPEDINDNAATAPSKRIERHIVNYKKRLHGPAVAKAIGLAKIRSACPRFDHWVSRLEILSGSVGQHHDSL